MAAQNSRAEGDYRLHEAEWLLSFQVGPDEIATRLGVAAASLERLAIRRGRLDLARRLRVPDDANKPCVECGAPRQTRRPGLCRECYRERGSAGEWSRQGLAG